MPANFNTGAGYMTGAWHNDMKVFQERLSVSEAMVYADMDYDYHKVPNRSVYVDDDGKEYYSNEDDNTSYTIWRSPTSVDPKPICLNRSVGKKYSILQNMDIARLLDPLTPDWPVETVGVLHDWKVTWATLLMEPFDIGGQEQEAHKIWLMVSDDKRKPGAAFWGHVVQRIVCANTYQAAFASAKEMTRIPHSSNVELEIGFRADLARHAIEERKRTIDQFNAMIKAKITEQQAELIFADVFPFKAQSRESKLINAVPDGVTGQYVDRMALAANEKEKQEAIRNEFATTQRNEALLAYRQFNDEFSYAAETAYAAFQAVTWQTNHSNIYRGDDLTSVLFGDRQEYGKKALVAALQYVS